MQNVKLNNGLEIPQIGFGMLRISDSEVQDVVVKAIKNGYRQIDGAAGYENEKGVGLGIKKAINELGVNREELWITSKVRDSMQGYDKTLEGFEKTLNDLQLDYLDMYMIHWPVPQNNLYLETWKAFEELYKQGRVKTIAVCNFLKPYLQNLLDNCEIPPAVNQLEIHPSWQQTDDANFSKENGVAVQAYSPIARGKDLENEEIKKIATETEQSPAKVILRWHIQKGNIIIPKTVNENRMRENLDLFNFNLSEEQMQIINQLNLADGSMGHDPHTYSYS